MLFTFSLPHFLLRPLDQVKEGRSKEGVFFGDLLRGERGGIVLFQRFHVVNAFSCTQGKSAGFSCILGGGGESAAELLRYGKKPLGIFAVGRIQNSEGFVYRAV